MSSDLIANLQIDKDLKTCKFIVVKEINNCDSSFIISSVIGHCMKNKHALLIINMHNSITHYQNVGLRMNYNLKKCISTHVDVYNVSEQCVTKLLNHEAFSIEDIYKDLQKKIITMQDKFQTVNVIFDGVSHLFDLNFTLKQVNNLCCNIIKLVRKCGNSFVIMNCNVAGDDDVTHVIANLLSHKADTLVQVESLPSGWSADVSGHLTFRYPGRRFENDSIWTMDMKPTIYLFKLFDKGVKLFAPGTV